MSQAREPKPAAIMGKMADGNERTNLATAQPAAALRTVMTPDQEREVMIEVAAYLRAEKRGFEGGDPMQDWLDAEREVDAMLKDKTRDGR